jgi:GMP synthase-like glutamine amidotransferase
MKKLRIHYFLHVPFEGPGSIEEWALNAGHLSSSTKFYENAKLPEMSEFDWLIVMGGTMSVYDESKFPWLTEEIHFIREAIRDGKTVLGICLGSQLISASLCSRVYQNGEKEIGWFDIEFTSMAKENKLFTGLGDKLTVFHWHGDTFDLPYKAIHMASSPGCRNQAYLYENKVLALQFHLETTEKSLQQMLDNGRNKITPSKYAQTENEILMNKQFIESNRKILFSLLDRLSES